MDNTLHPELAYTAGIEQNQIQHEIHPSLQAEVVPEEPVQEVAAESEQPQEQVQAAPVEEKPQDRDWRAVRQRAEEAKQLEREKAMIERERDFYREQALKQQQSTQPIQEDYRTDTEKYLQQQIEQLKQETERQKRETALALQKATILKEEQRLMQDFPDIKKVVSDDNVERLRVEHPDLYRAVVSSSDVYDVGAAAYKMIKAMNIYKEQPNTLSQLAQSATKNQSKPRSASMASPQSGDTPIQRASEYMGNSISTEEERKALYKEMVQASRNRIF